MVWRPDIYVDADLLVMSLWPQETAARNILRMAEARAIQLHTGSEVLRQLEQVLRAKAPAALGLLALLLDRCGLRIAPPAGEHLLRGCGKLVGSETYAAVIAPAWPAGVDYFATANQGRFLNNVPLRGAAPFPIGTPRDCLAWYRAQLQALT